MKKFIVLLALVALLVSCAEVPYPVSADARGQMQKSQTVSSLMDRIPTPVLTGANEREMIAKRATLFDTKNKLGYVYLIANSGDVIGYYTIFGKMASLNSYLVPQQLITDEMTRRNSDGTFYRTRAAGYYVLDDADIDGTYGSNIEGVFFFTDNGTYVELPTTAGITPIYSDKPLPIQATKFN